MAPFGLHVPLVEGYYLRLVLPHGGDLVPVLDDHAVTHALRVFGHFYNGHRPHPGIANARPLQPRPVPLVSSGQIASLHIRRCDRLGG
jgi:putative transposase